MREEGPEGLRREDVMSMAQNIVRESGGKPFLKSNVCLVGQGRSGKTAVCRGLSGKTFIETSSTVGVEATRLEVNTTNIEAAGASCWRKCNARNELEEAVALLAVEHIRGALVPSKQPEQDIFHMLDDGPEMSVVEDNKEVDGERGKERKKEKKSSAENDTVHGESSHLERPHRSLVKLNEELVFKYVNEKDNFSQDILRLTLTDFGGQDVFYTLHHLFLKRFAIFLVCFNMEWLYPQASPEDRREALAFIRFWLNSVAVHTVDHKGESFAPVLLVGTHKDIVSDKKIHEQISDLLYKEFHNSTAWRSVNCLEHGSRATGKGILWFFPVDNTVGHADPVMQQLMSDVQKCVMAEEYVQRKVPLSWLGVIDVLSQDRRVSISLGEFESTAAQCGLPESGTCTLQQECQLLLKLLNNLGILMYNLEPALCHIIILNPAEYLAGPATRVICQYSIHELDEHRECKRSKLSHLFTKLCKNAILDRSLLPILWKKFAGQQAELETLMVKFGLFVPLAAGDSGEDDRYLVPSILPRTQLNQDFEGHVSVCYIVFAEREVFKEWSKSSYVPAATAASEGFLPMGIFSRFLGKASVWCQLTTGTCVSGLDLTVHEARLGYGNQSVILQEEMEKSCIRVIILSERPLSVIDVIRKQISEVLNECVPNLRFALTVPSDGGFCLQGRVDYKDMSLVFLDSLLKAEQGLQIDKVRPGQSGLLSQTQLREKFKQWLPPSGLRCWYDVFLSYRWGALDDQVAETLFVKLSGEVVQESGQRGVEVFRDRERLECGGSFQKDFFVALINSAGAVPLVSASALFRMKSLTPESEVDNVLLEWAIIVELHETKRQLFCVPLFIGEARDPSKGFPIVTDLFSSGIFQSLPDVICVKCVAMAEGLLRGQGMEPSPELGQRTVRQTVNKICGFLGVKAWDLQTSHCKQFVSLQGTTVLSASSPSAMHEEARLKASAFETIKEAIMERVRKSERDQKHPRNNNTATNVTARAPAQAQVSLCVYTCMSTYSRICQDVCIFIYESTAFPSSCFSLLSREESS